MAKCETMRVRVEGQKDPIVINVADFDSALHKRMREERVKKADASGVNTGE
jgi:hypothetical protein